MCGIYGSTILYNEHQIREKLKRIQFRGPDQTGYKKCSFNGNTIILGHNRLSILDLDPRANQPFNYLEQLEIVFNGEIYNFKELKDELKHKGYQFKTTSDTEVICAAYLEYGNNCLNHMNGMFAFVIYDIKKQILFGARDRLGKKPFYYFLGEMQFEFASQISSIQLFNSLISISKRAIINYLSWGVIPDNSSIFNEIRKLPAGHYFNYDLMDGKFICHQYWDIDYLGKNKFSGTYEEALNKLETLTYNAVKNRLFADVPVGVFLSGGIDSSLVAAMATKSSSEKVKTFSVKFNEKGFDESSYAQQVAHHLKTDHHVIECNYSEGIDLIENFTQYYDEPFADSSAIPSMLLAKHTRKQVTVALSGDGGDESFIGYHRYDWVRYLKLIYTFPKPFRLLAASTLNILPYYRLKIIAQIIKLEDVNHAYLNTIYGTNPNWVVEDAPNFTDFEEMKYLFHSQKNIYERASNFDIKTYLNWDINTKMDRASMAFSLEARAPLMDFSIVEFANSLPTEFKYKKNNQKRILKDLLYQHVPKNIFDRPKSGFTMPIKEWFKNELKDFVISELSEESLKSIPGIKIDEILKMINQHMDGSWNRSQVIWNLIILKQWLNRNEKGLTIK